MIWADWVIVAIFGLSCLVGVIRGFVRESLSLAIWVAAALIAKMLGASVSLWLTELIATPSLRVVTAYAAVFVAILLLGAMLSYLVGTLIRATGLSGTDRLLGILFGALRAFIVVMVLVIWLPEALPVEQDLWWSQSQLLPFFIECEVWVVELYQQLASTVVQLWDSADATEVALPLPTENRVVE